MGAAASVNDNAAAVAEAEKLTGRGSPAIAPMYNMPDVALREALRQLQLSPDMIDKSASAIYAHARDPVEHPVDRELARLCASEYTRGALNALAAYVLHSSDGDFKTNGSTSSALPTKTSTTRYSVESKVDDKPASVTAVSRQSNIGGTRMPSAGGGGGGGGGEGGSLLTESMSGRLSTIFNRLRRTRSMPSRDNGVTSHASAADKTAAIEHSVAGAGTVTAISGGISEEKKNGTPPRLHVRVKHSHSPRRPYSLAGLGLTSPRTTKIAPRRAPVRTGHWKLGHEIGKGSFGAVHIGLNEDSGDLIAVKVLSLRHADTAEPLYREIELMRQLSHPNIVCYLGAEVNDSDKTISIFQEWVPGSVTTLLVNFGPFSDRRVAGYTEQILQGLLYLHNERVIHRDIKGGNILIDDRGVVKLCDFGASKMLDTESFTGMGDHTRVGSPLFMAPEILLRQDYGPQVDIWSLGGAVLEMATGQPPWHTLNLRTPVALLNWVKRTEGPPPLPEGLSSRLTKFLLRCFERDPKKRATAKDLLSDPFVSKRHGEVLKHSASDADSVSDIANLSRTAAIARMRRASCSDCSRPSSAGDSSCASDSTPGSPRSAQQARGTAAAAAGHAGGGRKGSVSPSSRSPRGGEVGRGRSFVGGAGASELGSHAAPAVDVRRVRPAGNLSVQTGVASSPQRDTSAVESTAPSASSPCVTTPPPRRVPAGGFRSCGTSPNPFSGRRRSVEHSPENARSSPRASTTSASPARQQGAAQPRDGTVASSGVDGVAAGREAGGAEEGGEGGNVIAPGNVPTVVMSREAVHVNAVRGSRSSELKRRESSSSIGSVNNGGKGGEEKKGGTISVVPAPMSDSPSQERSPSKKGRSGRGGRPKGGAIGSGAANSGGAGDVSGGDAAESAWRWNQ